MNAAWLQEISIPVVIVAICPSGKKTNIDTPTETKGQFAQEAETEIFYKHRGKSATF